MKTLIMKNGEKYNVLSETDNRYICKGTQFRKGNPHIDRIEETKEKKEKKPKKVEEVAEVIEEVEGE